MRHEQVSVFCLFVALALAATAASSRAEPPSDPVSSFSKAKKLARADIYRDHRQTLYCDCGFKHSRTASGGTIDNTECGYRPRKSEWRGKRLEWEHIMPASAFGSSRSCWQVGHERCVRANGTAYKGRDCCKRVDDEFKRIEADLHNLAPSIGELNGDRNDLWFGTVAGERREYGACDFEIDRRRRLAEPMPAVRGDVARVWLYMSETYDVSLPQATRNMLVRWDASDPPDAWEQERDLRIAAIQGNTNPFIQRRIVQSMCGPSM